MRLIAVALTLSLITLPAHAKSGKSQPLVVTLKTSHGQDAGTATFKQAGDRVAIKLKLKNLPIGEHAVHIHQNPQCDAPDFKAAGPHFNPAGKQHGMLNPMGHHNGDLPNISIDQNHVGEATLKVDYLSLDPAAADSLFANGGTSIVVHERSDDMKTDPAGNAGNRIACGVITAARP